MYKNVFPSNITIDITYIIVVTTITSIITPFNAKIILKHHIMQYFMPI